MREGSGHVVTLEDVKSAVLPAALLVGASACSGGTSAASTRTTTLTVLAAASLKETFTDIGAAFEAAHPGVHVRFSFAGSSTLAEQITAGSPADVFAAASTSTMQTVLDAQLVAGAPVVFARNRLELAVARHGSVRSLADAVRSGVRLALCAPAVPCGAAARRLLAAEHLTAHPVTEEQDVKSVLAKVQLGEADCGLVYVTDVHAAAGKVLGVPLPDVPAAVATYPIASLRRSGQPSLAQEFVAAVTSAAGEQVLQRAGFLPPA